MTLTVGKLKAAMGGLPDDTPVAFPDTENDDFFTNAETASVKEMYVSNDEDVLYFDFKPYSGEMKEFANKYEHKQVLIIR